jgi:hypothetical protein
MSSDDETEITRLRAERKEMLDALNLAVKYVLVQTCGLSLTSEEAKQDLAVIEAIIAKVKEKPRTSGEYASESGDCGGC